MTESHRETNSQLHRLFAAALGEEEFSQFQTHIAAESRSHPSTSYIASEKQLPHFFCNRQHTNYNRQQTPDH